MQQCELAIIIYLSPPLWPPSPPLIPPSRLTQIYRLGFLHYTETYHQLCILNMMVYIWQCCFLHCPRSLFPLLCSRVCSLCLCLHPLKLDLLKSLFSLVQSASHVQLFATPWIAAGQASLSASNFKWPRHGVLKYMRSQGKILGYHSENSDPFSMKMLKKWKMVRVFYLFNWYAQYIIQNARMD